MRNYIFLYKDNTEDRDCCAYIETTPERFECNHYFGSVILHGACYSGHNFANYEDIRTVLTEDEYNQLIKFSKEINGLGYGITKGDERYTAGIELCKAIQPVYDKLLSEENEEFFEQIQEEEKEYLMDEYGFDEDDIEYIFNNYSLDYRDRGVVGCVFDSAYDLGYEVTHDLGIISDNYKDIVENYFDFEAFGEALAQDDENYLKLTDGRCVYLNY